MTSPLEQHWIPLARIAGLIQFEPALVVLGLTFAAWLIYKIFLRSLSAERHRNIRKLFVNLLVHLAAASVLFLLFQGLLHLLKPGSSGSPLARITSYVGLLALFYGTLVFIKTWRILVFEYLFFGNMKAGVPVLLVNLFSLLLSLLIGTWLLSAVFEIRLAPLLATSAIFSLVLGLALQDTLGNLFAGIALQMDKPFNIGDWVEINAGSQKWAGQVHEISWRAAVLIGMTDELLTLPNRTIAQAEIANFSSAQTPFVRVQVFKLPYGTPIDQAKRILAHAAGQSKSVQKQPAPFATVSEVHESWIAFKVVYFITEYGRQTRIADEVLSAALVGLEEARIPVAAQRISVLRA